MYATPGTRFLFGEGCNPFPFDSETARMATTCGSWIPFLALTCGQFYTTECLDAPRRPSKIKLVYWIAMSGDTFTQTTGKQLASEVEHVCYFPVSAKSCDLWNCNQYCDRRGITCHNMDNDERSHQPTTPCQATRQEAIPRWLFLVYLRIFVYPHSNQRELSIKPGNQSSVLTTWKGNISQPPNPKSAKW